MTVNEIGPRETPEEARTPTALRILIHREWWEWLPEAYQMSRVRGLGDVFAAIEAEAARSERERLRRLIERAEHDYNWPTDISDPDTWDDEAMGAAAAVISAVLALLRDPS